MASEALPELLVVRHGETEWNRLGRWQGPLDSPLTATGEDQARAVGRLLRDVGVTPATHRFDCSPQGRAVRTAELILDGAGVPRIDERLREIGVGDWAGRLREELMAEAGLGPGARMLDLYARAPGGEPFAALYARVSEYFAEISGPTVVVTHGITSRFLRAAALGLPPESAGDVPGGQGVVHRILSGAARDLEDRADLSGPGAWARAGAGRVVSSAGRASRLHRGCRGFEPLTTHHPGPAALSPRRTLAVRSRR